jgi:hemerythrin-like domain-containing protein
MLAAESAWLVLQAEHACMRGLLGEIDEELRSERWRHAQRQAQALQRLVQCLRSFDDAVHRPKGVTLLATLRGRSKEVDQLLDRLDAESRQCQGQLAQALDLLDRVSRGDRWAADQCTALLQQHRNLMLRHLDEEDAVLLPYTARLLSPEDWSTVVSSMSSLVERSRPLQR